MTNKILQLGKSTLLSYLNMAAAHTNPNSEPTTTYLVLDLEALTDVDVHPGDSITLQNLGTQHPTIVLQSGDKFQATYKESIGTHMVYTTELQQQPGDDQEPSLRVQYLCHTTNTLCALHDYDALPNEQP